MNERKTSAAKAKRKTLNTRKRKVRQTGRRKRKMRLTWEQVM